MNTASAAWGGIVGDITSQTDLINLLDNKYDKTGGVITGDVTVNKDTPKLILKSPTAGNSAELEFEVNNLLRSSLTYFDADGATYLTRYRNTGTSETTLKLSANGIVSVYEGNGVAVDPIAGYDLVNKKYADTKEPDLGNPTTDGQVLQSSAAGARYWGSAGTGAGDFLSDGSVPMTGPITGVDATNNSQLPTLSQVEARVAKKNYFINPIFTINQRGYVSGVSSTDAKLYTHDRWKLLNNTDIVGFFADIAMIFDSSALQQRLEDFGYEGQVTVSWEGTAVLDLARKGGSNLTSPHTFVLETGVDTDGVKEYFNFHGAGVTVTLKNPKLELGSVQTPFEYPMIGEELAKCQRYFQHLIDTPIFLDGYNISDAGISHLITYPVEMRVIPGASITWNNPSNGNHFVREKGKTSVHIVLVVIAIGRAFVSYSDLMLDAEL